MRPEDFDENGKPFVKTLRDEFAMVVLPMVYEDAEVSDSAREIAARAYNIAEAMLAERER